MKTLNYLILTFAAAFLILAGLSSCKKQTADNKPTPDVSFEKLTFKQIKDKEREMRTDRIPLKKGGTYLLKPGTEIIIFKTNEGRYGKMSLTNTERYLIKFKGVCYNSDGSEHKASEEFALTSSFNADLDILLEEKVVSSSDMFFDAISDYEAYLVSKNEAKFAVLK